MLLLAFSLVRSERERILGMNVLLFGLLVVIAGFAAYAVDARLRLRRKLSS
jgi:hypothetical protein